MLGLTADPWIIVPKQTWRIPRWLVVFMLVLNISAVLAFVAHGFAAGSIRSLFYAVIGGSATLTWLALRRESRAAARVADAMLLGQLCMPVLDWLSS
jgi:Flp pilus assembly protein protease CpaA